MSSKVFDAGVLGASGGAYVKIPFDVKDAFGSGRPKVIALRTWGAGCTSL